MWYFFATCWWEQIGSFSEAVFRSSPGGRPSVNGPTFRFPVVAIAGQSPFTPCSLDIVCSASFVGAVGHALFRSHRALVLPSRLPGRGARSTPTHSLGVGPSLGSVPPLLARCCRPAFSPRWVRRPVSSRLKLRFARDPPLLPVRGGPVLSARCWSLVAALCPKGRFGLRALLECSCPRLHGSAPRGWSPSGPRPTPPEQLVFAVRLLGVTHPVHYGDDFVVCLAQGSISGTSPRALFGSILRTVPSWCSSLAGSQTSTTCWQPFFRVFARSRPSVGWICGSFVAPPVGRVHFGSPFDTQVPAFVFFFSRLMTLRPFDTCSTLHPCVSTHPSCRPWWPALDTQSFSSGSIIRLGSGVPASSSVGAVGIFVGVLERVTSPLPPGLF